MSRELFYKVTGDFLNNKITADEWVAHALRYHSFDAATQNLVKDASAATLREYARATKRLLEQ